MKRNRTTLSQGIDLTTDKERYDACCKRILAEKIILAWIMKHTMIEYESYEVGEIADKYIDGKPQIANVKVMPDADSVPRIEGVGVEDNTVNEGTVVYDIRFRAIVPRTEKRVELIINVEAQNDYYPGYPVIKRGIYYCGRLISAQYGTVFINSHYEKIQKVYSVWICTNPPISRQYTITKYSISENNIVGNVKEKEQNYDLMTAVVVCLGKNNHNEIENKLLSMLDVLLSSELDKEKKKEVLEKDYGIPMSVEMEGEMEDMCNLSDGVERKGIEKGIKIGHAQGIEEGIEQGIEQVRRTVVINMLHLNKEVDEICACVGCDKAYVTGIKSEIANI